MEDIRKTITDKEYNPNQSMKEILASLGFEEHKLTPGNANRILNTFGVPEVHFLLEVEKFGKPTTELKYNPQYSIVKAWLISQEKVNQEERRQLDKDITKATGSMSIATWVIGFATIVNLFVFMYSVFIEQCS